VTSTTIHPYDLDPTLLADRTYETRRRRRFLDVTALINAMVVLTLLLPTRLTIPALTGVGRPAMLVGLLVAGLWFLSRLAPAFCTHGRQPMRWAAAGIIVSLLLSYAAGQLRGLPSLESNGADTALIATIIFLGIILAVADFVPTRSRLDAIVHTAVWAGAIMALVGHIEFAFDIAIPQYIKIPGLVLHGELTGVEARGFGFFRVASMATHYIEFSIVMALILPLAIHVVLHGRTRAVRRLGMIAALLIGTAIPVTLSRTGFLALFIGMLVMLPAWSWRARLNIGAAAIVAIAGIVLVRPGLLGTIRSLFLNMGNDPSIQGRTMDYDLAWSFIGDRPLLGRGFGTFIPDLYTILDNQWLQTLIGGGLVGLCALVGLHLTAIVLSAQTWRRATTDVDRHLCACLIAAQLMAMVAHLTFDSFAFNSFITMLALLTGLAGATWRLAHPNRQLRTVGVAAADH
jgi:O-antigen ligase